MQANRSFPLFFLAQTSMVGCSEGQRSTTPPGQRSLWVLWIEKLKKMLPNAMPKIPHTLSSAAPTKAAQIRSAVTGALIRESLGLLCFEHTVETTFLLPWDLNPKVWRFK